MPRDDQNRRSLANLMGRVNQTMDTLYTSTYYTRPNNSKALDQLRDKIDQNLDRIVNANMDTMGIPSVSKVYSRLKLDLDRQDANARGKATIEDYFNDALNYDDFFATFQSNRYLLEMDAEIDSTCKYFPELEEAIAVMKEGVLSPDYFSKDFLSLSTTSTQQKDDFDDRAKELKQRYNLLPLIEDVYYHTSKYGEDFIYCVPYSTALSRLLTDKPKTSLTSANIEREQALTESFTLSVTANSSVITDENNKAIIRDNNPVIFNETTSLARTEKMVKDNKGEPLPVREAAEMKPTPILGSNEQFKLNIEICRKGIIESIVQNAKAANEKRSIIESTSNQFSNEVLNEKGEFSIVKKDKKTGKLVIDGLEDEMKDSLTSDGMINLATQDRTGKNEIKVDVPGCVVARIKREQVIPIYIGENNTCLGFYYIELRSYEALEDFRGLNYIMSDSLTSIRGSNSGMNAPFNCVDPSRQEELLNTLQVSCLS